MKVKMPERLTIYRNGNTVQYRYNGDGLLTGRIESGVETRYYYDEDQIIAEATVEQGTPKLKASYIRGNRLEAIRYANGSEAYPVYNGHGDIVQLQDAAGAVLAEYTYDIWGNPLEDSGNATAVHNPFRYSGELWDDTVDLQYLRARWYDPSVGRFLNEDTFEGELDDPLTLNLYTYVINNPLKYVDSTGNRHEAGAGWSGFVGDKNVSLEPWKGWSGPAGSTINFLLLDDVNTLRDPNAANYEKTLAVAGFIPMGKFVGKGYKVVKYASKEGRVIFIRISDDVAEKINKLRKKKVPSCNCFAAGTKVQTDEGEKNIEDIEVGDQVLAKDELNPDGELAYKEVTALYRNQRDDIIKLHVGEQVIETTDNHPFWVEGKGWIFADELQVGDKLQKADGSNLMIDKVEFLKLDKPITVYNFTVADFHTYYVTDIGIWVHNTDCSLFPNLEKKYKKHVSRNMEYAEVFPNMTREQFLERTLNLATNKADGRTIFRKTRARDGAIITYSKATNEIVFEKNGVIDTFFRPENGKAYFDAQFK
ncbi:polymorphic toxin-type HINT domain-containing protein [Paenibacillus massiliensis]|uniref:polymorphic toxin-type HINT domain-containing protein n=1 Tax=Paenibacillus massiliensis TaxID=225917 RepID=UPI001E3A979B|nr:polymorphic toxin-type HINT domain-containing protein [Paenibacillus massiliensis]